MFDDFADAYEAMIDWPKRLAHEEPFYRRLFDRLRAGSVLDAACGTGQHAAMFHSWGLQVEGADVSPVMIERAKTKFGEPRGLQWTVRGFEQPVEPAATVRRGDLRRQLAGAGPRRGDGRAGDPADAGGGARRGGHRRSGLESLAPARRPLPMAEMPASRLAQRRPHHQGRSSLRRSGIRRIDRGRAVGRRVDAQ